MLDGAFVFLTGAVAAGAFVAVGVFVCVTGQNSSGSVVFPLTVTLHEYFFFLILALIFAFPTLTAITLPVLLTMATLSLLDDHLAFLPVPLSFSFTLLPTVNVTFFLFSLILAFASPFIGAPPTTPVNASTILRVTAIAL